MGDLHEDLHNRAIEFIESQLEMNKRVAEQLKQMTELVNHANELLGILMKKVAVLEQEVGIENE